MGETHSIVDLILQAGPVVKTVMIILFASSVISWMFIIERWFYFSGSETRDRRFTDQFWSGIDLSELYKRGMNSTTNFAGSEEIFRSGFSEFSRLRKQQPDAEAVMEGAERAMRVALSREERALDKRLNFLATVGSTAPYIGLFGTVWGIMNAFRCIAAMEQATLSVVAPGISEALIATAIGLFAAIPAVVAYNRFSNRADSLLARYETFSNEFSSILHRQVYMRQDNRS